MRSIWSGSLSFGLINIPVQLYSATQDHALSFDMLHKTDLSPIRYARICKEDGKEIPYKDIVKGYEFQKGEYVVVTDEDFKRVDVKKSSTIDIKGFVFEDEIDAIFFEKPYYLEPAKGADKAYALLRDALRKSKKVGLVTYVFRNREHLGVIKPFEDAIILNQLRFASEIRDLAGLKLPKEGLANKKEVEVALKLIDQLTTEFVPEDYQDTYIEELKGIIDQKVKGITPRKRAPAKAKSSKVHDIMSLLKASLDEEKAHHKAPTKPRKKAA